MAMDSNGIEREEVKSLSETDKKCPNCGGTMTFDPASGKMKCPYCEAEFEVKQSAPAPTEEEEEAPLPGVGQVQQEGAAKENEFDISKLRAATNSDWGTATKMIICKSCGGEMILDKNDISTMCPFCGSTQVTDATDDSNTLAPGGVVPFQITQELAAEKFGKWIKGKFFAPKAAKESAKADHFQGVYLPYWTFDAQTESDYRGQYGVEKKTRKSNGETQTQIIWHPTSGHVSKFFDDTLICGSAKQDRMMLRGIAPFRTGENKVYTPEYLAGFAAERYTVPIEDAWKEAQTDMTSSIRSEADSQIRGNHHTAHSKVDSLLPVFSNVTYKYLMLPVWFSSFNFNGKVYQFVVNGQTGKVSGRSPVSAIKVILTILAFVILFYIFFVMGD